jgi:hypothetical protein
MIRNIPGFAPIATDGDKVPTSAPKAGAPTLPTVDRAKALAAARATQVLNYTRRKEGETPLKTNLRTDGPTLEKWLEAGYPPDKYPPEGYAELDSPALTGYKAALAEAASKITSATPPHSVNDKPEVPK